MEAKQRHEDFRVEPKTSTHQLRQDRYEPSCWSMRLFVDGHELEVTNYAVFGIAVVAPGGFACAVKPAASLVVHGVVAQQLTLRRVRIESRGDGRQKIAFAVEGELIGLNRIEALVRAHDALAAHGAALERMQTVPPALRARIYEIKHALESLEKTVDATACSSEASFEERIEFERSVIDVVASHIDGLFVASFGELAALMAGLDAGARERCHQLFRAELGAIFDKAPILARSYAKPLGYAGDYDMMKLIYRDEALGATRFARCLSRYAVNNTNSRAVRNRAEFLLARIRRRLATATSERPLRILSVACGPAREIQLLLEDEAFDARTVEIDLLDQDASALRSTQRQIAAIAGRRGIDVRVGYLHMAMANVLTGGLDGEYDLVYSAGLFDYFSNPLAHRAAARLHARLAPGGELIIGNFREVPHNRAFIELALDWKLIYRDVDDLRALFGDIGNGVDVDAEPENINLFVTLGR
ncbi:MAG: class I SAM-dependent methyltransferase family protein [Polyangia bacterium]